MCIRDRGPVAPRAPRLAHDQLAGALHAAVPGERERAPATGPGLREEPEFHVVAALSVVHQEAGLDLVAEGPVGLALV
eukprot:3577579-Alexandrium_andersonii.AAC.1